MYKNKLVLLILIMAASSVCVASMTIFLLYRNTMEDDKRGLWELAESHALVRESIYRETRDKNETLKIFSEVNDDYKGIGKVWRGSEENEDDMTIIVMDVL